MSKPTLDGRRGSIISALSAQWRKKDKKDCCPLRMNYSSSSHTDDLLKATDVLRSPASQSLL